MTLTISNEAFDLIESEEVGSEGYYTRCYEHFDWPAGASGPTIGIGYDCGYVMPDEARADWNGIVEPAAIEVIVSACGIKGQAAAAWVKTHRDAITVTWDQAATEFRNREVPKWLTRLEASLPNLDKLSPDSLGALLSLAYNRGCSFDLPGARYAEMRAIKALMNEQEFLKISAEFISMQRLWPKGGDLWNRRAHEAALFAKGLTG